MNLIFRSNDKHAHIHQQQESEEALKELNEDYAKID